MKSRAVVLLNAAAGSVAPAGAAETSARVVSAFAEAGLTATVTHIDCRSLPGEIREAVAAGADRLIVGGGDGTLSTAAEALAGGNVPLGILPLGTRNHFARDLGLSGDLAEAVRVVTAGHVRHVDVGDINGRVFLNNCSLGLYPDMVRDRETQEVREERGHWPAMLRASWGSLQRFRARTVAVHVDGRVSRMTTPLVFVGNNRYETRLLALGRRSALDEGLLWLYVARNTSRLGIVRLAARMLLGRLEQAQDFETIAAPGFEVRTRRKHVRVAVDGEVLAMSSPLRWSSRPAGLPVLAPPAEP